jgi:hypothetical protein
LLSLPSLFATKEERLSRRIGDCDQNTPAACSLCQRAAMAAKFALIAVDLVSDEMSEEELERYECVKATRRPPSPRE